MKCNFEKYVNALWQNVLYMNEPEMKEKDKQIFDINYCLQFFI